jgi:hypothetical protein
MFLRLVFEAVLLSVSPRALRGITHYLLFGCSSVFSGFHSFVSCGISVKNRKNYNPLVLNINDTKLRKGGKKYHSV